MNDQTERILKNLKRDANDSRDKLLNEIGDRVQVILNQNFETKEFSDSISVIKQNAHLLEKLGELSLIKDKLVETNCDIDDLTRENSKIIEEIRKVQKSIKSEDVIEIKNKLSKNNKEIEVIRAGNVKLLECIQLVQESIKSEDIIEIKNKLDIRNQEITEIKEKNTELLEGLQIVQSSINSEDVAEIKNKLDIKNQDIEDIKSKLELRNQEIGDINSRNAKILEDLQNVQEKIKTDEVILIKNKVEENCVNIYEMIKNENEIINCLRAWEHTVISKFDKKTRVLYILNIFSVIGIIALLILNYV